MRFFTTTLGLKVLMAITGLALIGFVVVHMIGNLQIFLPVPETGMHAIDEYAKLLKSNAAVLWGARLVLLGSVGGHIYAAWKLTQRSNSARPRQYEVQRFFSNSYAVHTMRWGGVIVLLFIIYHLLHLTVGMNGMAAFTDIAHCTTEECFVRENVIKGFSNPFISSFYIIAQAALGLHLAHGVWSLFRTLGVTSSKWNERSKMLALGLGGLITLGNSSIPLAILMGIIS